MNTTEDRLLNPSEVAALFRVDPKTVTRWANAGWINSFRTPGGHRRFRESDVRHLIGDEPVPVGHQLAVAQLIGVARVWRAHIAAAERSGATVRAETRALAAAIDALPTEEDRHEH